MIIVINVTYNDNCDGNSNNDSDNDILQASAFSVPPQQFISSDGGIVEMGAEVYLIFFLIIVYLLLKWAPRYILFTSFIDQLLFVENC